MRQEAGRLGGWHDGVFAYGVATVIRGVAGRVAPAWGEEVAVKAYWLAAGLGTLVAVIGMILYMVSDHQLGIILILGGLIVATMGLVMRLIQAGVDNSGKRAAKP